MFRGIFALFFRSLKSESRSFWIHFSRFVLLSMFYFGLNVAQQGAGTLGAPGLALFSYSIYANASFLTLLGISYFSSVISEEREEDTLGLISMTGVSSLSLLLGKSTTRLFQVLLFLAIQYPFTLLAITLGGLVPAQIVGAYVALAAYAIFIANAGLCCSVLCRRSRDAASLTLLCVVSYAAFPFFAMLMSHSIASRINDDRSAWAWIGPYIIPTLNWITATNIFGEFQEITSSTYQFHVSPQMISNVIAGVLLFFLSWWLFGVISHDQVPETSGTTPIAANSPTLLQRLRAGRTWKWAIVWKDFHFIAGGWYGIVTRAAIYVGLFLVGLGAQTELSLNGRSSFVFSDLLMTYRLFVIPIFVIDCALCLSRPFQDEIRQQTLSSILLLPYSIWHIVGAKWLGCLLGLIPGMIAISLAYIIPVDGTSLQATIVSYEFWWMALCLLLLLQLCAVLSTFMRTAIIVTAFALTVGWLFLAALCAEWLDPATSNWTRYYWTQFALLLPAIMACPKILVSRLGWLGSK